MLSSLFRFFFFLFLTFPFCPGGLHIRWPGLSGLAAKRGLVRVILFLLPFAFAECTPGLFLSQGAVPRNFCLKLSRRRAEAVFGAPVTDTFPPPPQSMSFFFFFFIFSISHSCRSVQFPPLGVFLSILPSQNTVACLPEIHPHDHIFLASTPQSCLLHAFEVADSFQTLFLESLFLGPVPQSPKPALTRSKCAPVTWAFRFHFCTSTSGLPHLLGGVSLGWVCAWPYLVRLTGPVILGEPPSCKASPRTFICYRRLFASASYTHLFFSPSERCRRVVERVFFSALRFSVESPSWQGYGSRPFYTLAPKAPNHHGNSPPPQDSCTFCPYFVRFPRSGFVVCWGIPPLISLTDHAVSLVFFMIVPLPLPRRETFDP